MSQTVHDAKHNRTLGARGEDIAAEYLESLGFQIIERNWRGGRTGELDIIAAEGDAIVAVEVKTRGGLDYGHPLEAITAAKARRLRRLLITWIRERRPGAVSLRVDAIGIVLRESESPNIHHIRGIL